MESFKDTRWRQRFEFGWKVLKDYLESQGCIVKSPIETIKQAIQIGLIEEGHPWMDALSKRNLTSHTYDEAFAKKFITEIIEVYIPVFKSFHDKLLEE
jgi:nucleotidyltransferase substrate binding protein (TIGR01987 family)